MITQNEQKPLVLVVDDDVFMRGMLQNLLEEQGNHVIAAEDGQKALEAFYRHSPDLVLLDAAMPIMDGFTACAELKRNELAADVPVIMITSLDDEESVDKAFAAGAVEYITKPVHWSVLRHRVQVVLQARRAQIALRNSEARFRGIFEQSAMGIALLDKEGHLAEGNPIIQKMLGRSLQELQQKPFNRFFYPFDTNVEKEFHQQLLNDKRSFYQMEKYFFRKDSPMLWARITTSLVKDDKDEPKFVVQMVEDITERKRAQAKQRLAAKVFETTSNGVMITNAEGHIIDINQAFLLSTGYSYEEVLDQNPRFLRSGHHDKTFYEDMWVCARETGRWHGEILNKRKDGEVYSTWLSLSAVRGEHNEITHYVAVYSDLAPLREDDARLRLLTHYDALTELPNRLLFHEHLTRACRQEDRIALLYIDLDDFKSVNEDFSFDVGDEYLKQFAKKLRQCVRDGDIVARLDGDEFGVVLTPIDQEYDACTIAEKILDTVTVPMSIQGNIIQVDCNIGISLYANTQSEEGMADNVDILIQYADMAMYLAKETGKNGYHVYSEGVV